MNKITLQNCPICSSNNVDCIFTPTKKHLEEFKLLSQEKYSGVMDDWTNYLSLKLMRCQYCLHIWHLEIPDLKTLGEMYAGSSRRESLRKIELPTKRQNYILNEMQFLKAECSKNENPKILDYGSGRGHWVSGALKAGFTEVVAFDLSYERLSATRDEKHVRKVNDLSSLNDKFDAINCEQVLEHTIDPMKEIQSIIGKSDSSTVIRMTVPIIENPLDTDQVIANFPYGERKVHLLSPFEHIHGFSKKSFNVLFEQIGLQEKKVHLGAAIRFPRQKIRLLLGHSNFKLLTLRK